MQVANALNNVIRILFNPRVEPFKLFDFLVVKSDSDRYLAQIIEIYDDKFDASQNVAKIKLFYKITENNEVMPYDNFTPNKECEIIKVKQDEIEEFINQDKGVFIFGTNFKSSSSLKVQYDFFLKNCAILADKIENSTGITINLAKNLSVKKPVVVIDSTGVVEFDGAKKIKANKDFKMPLDFNTIDYIFELCLKDATLEFQTVAGDIINEIKKFAKAQENEFIPFNSFIRVILEQYKATPYQELKLLISRIKKCQMDEVFARGKKDKNVLFETINKNPITIVDVSSIKTSWQKAYLEYIAGAIEQEVILITRINDENCNVDLIHKIYDKKKNITFIPNVSYNYKKLPTLLKHCKNYLLMPSLYQRNDFLDANFALSNLIADGCILFGENTDGFLYYACDYELEFQAKRKNYRKIALSLIDDEKDNVDKNLGNKGDYFENKQNDAISDSKRLLDELEQFEQENKTEQTEEKLEQEEKEEEFEELEDSKTIQDIQEIKTEATDDFQDILEEQTEEKVEQEDVLSNNVQVETIEEEKEEDLIEIIEENQEEIQTQETLMDDNLEVVEQQEIQEENVEINFEENNVSFDDILEEEIKEEKQEKIKIEDVELIDPFEVEEEQKEENSKNEIEEQTEISDEELDFFQLAKDSIENNEENDIDLNSMAEASKEEELDLSKVADNSIDNSFNDIINTKNEQKSQTIELDSETKINIENTSQKENLPIFKEEKPKTSQKFEIGNVVVHNKYGRGTIVKTIKYEERQLLQIEFDESGKKLLDPTVANLKIEQ